MPRCHTFHNHKSVQSFASDHRHAQKIRIHGSLRTDLAQGPIYVVCLCVSMVARKRLHRFAPQISDFRLWGSSHRVYGEEGAPQGPTRCAPGAPLLGQYCLLWGESPNMTSPVHHQKPPCAYKHSSRQQHYNPPILDSTQFPQLGRTTNNPHPTLSFPIHNPHSTYST